MPTTGAAGAAVRAIDGCGPHDEKAPACFASAIHMPLQGLTTDRCRPARSRDAVEPLRRCEVRRLYIRDDPLHVHAGPPAAYRTVKTFSAGDAHRKMSAQCRSDRFESRRKCRIPGDGPSSADGASSPSEKLGGERRAMWFARKLAPLSEQETPLLASTQDDCKRIRLQTFGPDLLA
jgi:hypothetical protein